MYSFDCLQFPISIGCVCDFLGIDVLYKNLGKASGCYVEDPLSGKTFIVINDDRSVEHQRFSGAHEVGHAILRHSPISLMDGIVITPREKQQEAEANHFAAELLMPKQILKSNGPMTVQELTRFCYVSKEAARIRMEQLGWE
jgi:Zn-dependent peptidase ImmA (M78 family)